MKLVLVEFLITYSSEMNQIQEKKWGTQEIVTFLVRNVYNYFLLKLRYVLS